MIRISKDECLHHGEGIYVVSVTTKEKQDLFECYDLLLILKESC